MAVGFCGTRVYCGLLGLPGAAEQRNAPATVMKARRSEARGDAGKPGEMGRPKSKQLELCDGGSVWPVQPGVQWKSRARIELRRRLA